MQFSVALLSGCILYLRNPDPRARPQFGQINKILAKDARYLLAWPDEDKQSAGEDGMKLGASLQFTHNLYPDLQFTYKQN